VNNLKKEQTSDQNFQSSLIFFPSADVRKGSLHPKGGCCKKATNTRVVMVQPFSPSHHLTGQKLKFEEEGRNKLFD